MTNLPAILVGNGTSLILLCVLLVSSRKTLRHGMLDHKLFLLMIILDMLQSVLESISFVVDGQPGASAYWLVMMTNSLLFVNNICFAFTWTVFADYKLFADTKRIKRRYGFVAIPCLLMLIGCVINVFAPVFFSVTEDNHYVRDAFFPVFYLVTYLYLAYGVVLIYTYRHKVNRYLFMPAILFMIPIIIGSVMQYLFYGLSLIWIGTAIGLTALYINVQNEVSYVDRVSGSFTRQYLMQYLEQRLSGHYASQPMAGIMVDIDHFKSINDTYGHLVGDEAIARVGELLRSAAGSRALVMRYGGDEFVLLYPGDGKKLFALVAAIRSEVEALNMSGKIPYELHFSIGSGQLQPGDDVDTFLNRLDHAMYEDKRRKMTAVSKKA